MASGSVDLAIFDIRTLWDTVSNAAVKSTATQTVRLGGFFWLNPVAMSVVSWRSAEVVECPGRKPCWSGAGSRCALIMGRTSASKTFAAGHKSEIGRCALRRVLAGLRYRDDNR